MRRALPLVWLAAACAAPPATAPVPEGEGVLLGAAVVATAREAMGRPYRYGGGGDGREGFDCSGLIQHAWGRHGVSLPRTSADQATVGHAVERRLEALRPGDLLTFSAQPGGSRVSHVGMYAGAGRFIHSSSSRGVMESVLDDRDSTGRWWWLRWIGARRVAP